MTYEQYWYGDPLMVRAFRKAEQIKQQRVDSEAWLYGAYVCRALDSVVGNMFCKTKSDSSRYPDAPISYKSQEIAAETQREREEREATFALAYMTNMVRYGKNWGNKS